MILVRTLVKHAFIHAMYAQVIRQKDRQEGKKYKAKANELCDMAIEYLEQVVMGHSILHYIFAVQF